MATKTELQAQVGELEAVLSDVAGLIQTDDTQFEFPEDGDWIGLVEVVKARLDALKDEATAARAARTSLEDDLRRAREEVAELYAVAAPKDAPAKVLPDVPPQPTLGQMPPEALVQEVVRLRSDLATARSERDTFCRQVVEKG